MSDDLIQAISECDKVCEYIHLPVQSGDNEILAGMNRKYTREHYLKLINKLRTTKYELKFKNGWNPPISITTDIIVGFPGETEAQFQNTLKLTQEAGFNMAYIGQYSPRPKTAAYHFDDNVTRKEKRKREAELMKVIRKISLKNNQKYLGKTVDVLVEGKDRKGDLFGKTRTFKKVKLRMTDDKFLMVDLIGEFVKVKIIEARDLGLVGKIMI